ncbi:hypothetical protein IWZ01DRAFT_477963 [Phyllosticta capitalensis]
MGLRSGGCLVRFLSFAAFLLFLLVSQALLHCNGAVPPRSSCVIVLKAHVVLVPTLDGFRQNVIGARVLFDRGTQMEGSRLFHLLLLLLLLLGQGKQSALKLMFDVSLFEIFGRRFKCLHELYFLSKTLHGYFVMGVEPTIEVSRSELSFSNN